MKNEYGSINDVIVQVLKERYKVFLGILIGLVLISLLLNHLQFFDNLERSVNFFDNISERLVDFVIFLPSLTFACLGLLPSVGRNMKLKLIRPGTDGHKLIDSLLNQLSFIMYMSLVTLVISISVNAFLDHEASALIGLKSSCYWKLAAISFFVFFLYPACLVVDQLFMTVYIVHSLLIGDFKDAEKEFEEVKNLLIKNKVEEEDYDAAISKKIEDNLTSTSIDRLRELKARPKAEGQDNEDD